MAGNAGKRCHNPPLNKGGLISRIINRQKEKKMKITQLNNHYTEIDTENEKALLYNGKAVVSTAETTTTQKSLLKVISQTKQLYAKSQQDLQDLKKRYPKRIL